MTVARLQTVLKEALANAANGPARTAATQLLNALGYHSERRIDLSDTSGATFAATFDRDGRLEQRAMLGLWRSIEMVFQLTGEDLERNSQTRMVFDAPTFSSQIYRSFLFFAIDLMPKSDGRAYTRGELATITREVNKLFAMPVSVMFRHAVAGAPSLTLAIVTHRPHKRDDSRDVLEKVSLIRDIRCQEPHRAHLEILADLSLNVLTARQAIAGFDDLQRAWARTLDISELNRRFYREIANWYFWAVSLVEFPDDGTTRARRNADRVIRLITRLIFIWFLREKGLVSPSLFRRDAIEDMLGSLGDDDSSYYKAILQNLFFGTLNQEMHKRGFRRTGQNYGVFNLYRHEALFRDPAAALALFEHIPFLNGGLFECLDDFEQKPPLRIDAFSDRSDSQPTVPNLLFFAPTPIAVDLNSTYGTRGRRYETRGLFDILERYKFTVAENTPIEEDVALDPELLGQVFENLLAAYNPETETTARKETGSFYTPRQIVNYMVDESLIAYFEQYLTQAAPLILGVDAAARATLNERLRYLLAYSDAPHRFSAEEALHLIVAIDTLKVLDPACGSGAFPMGVLQKLVYLLSKLDPGNHGWKERQLKRAARIEDAMAREAAMESIEEAFERNDLDYGRKLFLIENVIYGVDIQPIAVQIAKLRCFISLIVDQQVHDNRENRGIRPLPNLETKFVAADALNSVKNPGQHRLRDARIEILERDLAKVRSQHFNARTPATKRKYRDRDRELRNELGQLLEFDGLPKADAEALAAWDPYSQNSFAPFFDPEWMFGIEDGFDITIGNPPYVRADAMDQVFRRHIDGTKQYETLWEKWDLYIPFIELGYKLLVSGGVTSMIVSDAFCHAKYAQKPQKWYLTHSKILRLDFFSKIKIFDAAVHNITYLFQKADGGTNQPQRRVHDPEFGNVQLLPTAPQHELTYRAFFPEDIEQGNFKTSTVLLKDVCYISKGMVVHADEEVARGEFELDDLVSLTRDKDHPKSFVEGKHLGRWIVATRRWLEWGTKRAPDLFSRPTFPQLYDVPEKLISVDMSAGVGQLRVVYDDQQLYHNHSAWSFVPWHSLRNVRNNSLKKVARYRDEPSRSDLPKREELEKTSHQFAVKYLLGVMNSTAARDFLRANRRSNIHLYPDDWKKLPIPDVPADQQQPIIALVDQILVAKQRDSAADVAILESEIDAHIYRLYGLTDAEIGIIEEQPDTKSTGDGAQ